MRDSESNLDFANARYYSSQFGRFMSPDPLAGDITDPQSLNRYAYVMNSPLSAIDPSGMDGCVLVDGVFNCVVTSGGGGSGDGGGPFGGGGGPFGGGSSFGGGSLSLCFFLDCGFGGGIASLPGPPSAADVQFEHDVLGGIGKELFNSIKGTGSLAPGLGWLNDVIPDLGASNSTQNGAMQATFVATLLIPGGGEEASAAKIEGKLAAKLGEFSIIDWRGYPKGIPRPPGPFRILEGAEYDAARNAANNANRGLLALTTERRKKIPAPFKS